MKNIHIIAARFGGEGYNTRLRIGWLVGETEKSMMD
jgi:hypothetical protein